MAQQSPMVSQYHEIKSRYKDAILFFRLGDFYEMFNDDALLASKELELTLTGRGQDENRMPMCGIPYHAAESYIAKLIEKGHKVAICEQIEDPKLAKGIVKRDVIRVITPGTIIETSILPQKNNNYLVALSFYKDKFGLAYLEYSTGEFKATEIGSKDKLKDEILRISPVECLVPDIMPDTVPELISFLKRLGIVCSNYKDIYDKEESSRRLLNHFKVASLESFGILDFQDTLGAACALLDYISETQKTTSSHINKISPYHIEEFMFIDSSTRKNLELVQTIRDKFVRGSLLWVLDQTKTNMGSRKLRQWILQPLLEAKQINNRLDAVEELSKQAIVRDKLAKALSSIQDLERLTAKIAASSANARDVVGLKDTLMAIPAIKLILSETKSKALKEITQIEELNELSKLVSNALSDDPPLAITEGGLIKKGYDQKLDELKEMSRSGKKWIAELELSERKRTGIKSLKVGYTRVFGYYIEISQSNLANVPEDYIRKQTLVNCERFITPELKEKEALLLNAQERMKQMEYEIFCQIRNEAAKFTGKLQEIASSLAALDIYYSLAEAAISSNYCRPEMTNDGTLDIKDSRHPVIERTIGEYKFISNDVLMDDKGNQFLLITGPNMAGKSTYMRQIALICVMAQIGSFVPAKSACLPIIDRVFTRIGAMDDIFSGQSTFMLEMTETANILNNATKNSLVILDEIGRGTSTFDGMSIAAAVAEYIHAKISAKTLFATHYHEITQLADKHPGMQNLNVAVLEEKDHVTFLYKIKPGAADKSYGIAVAKLAGLPKQVTDRAKEIYATLEMVENDLSVKKAKTELTSRVKKVPAKDQMGLF